LRVSGLPRESALDRPVFGVDAMQALELALQAAGLLLSRSPEFRAGQIEVWGKPPREPLALALPLPLLSLQTCLDNMSVLLERKTGLQRCEEWRRTALVVMREIALDLATLAAHVPIAPRRRPWR
jgi:hypothetical protein